jgi:hypothetical protein
LQGIQLGEDLPVFPAQRAEVSGVLAPVNRRSQLAAKLDQPFHVFSHGYQYQTRDGRSGRTPTAGVTCAPRE